jgi:hypothetical protein
MKCRMAAAPAGGARRSRRVVSPIVVSIEPAPREIVAQVLLALSMVRTESLSIVCVGDAETIAPGGFQTGVNPSAPLGDQPIQEKAAARMKFQDRRGSDWRLSERQLWRRSESDLQQLTSPAETAMQAACHAAVASPVVVRPPTRAVLLSADSQGSPARHQ